MCHGVSSNNTPSVAILKYKTVWIMTFYFSLMFLLKRKHYSLCLYVTSWKVRKRMPFFESYERREICYACVRKIKDSFS